MTSGRHIVRDRVEPQSCIGVSWDRQAREPVGRIWAAGTGGYAVVPVYFGDQIDTRAPRYWEKRHLDMPDGEGVFDIRRTTGLREILRGSQVAIRPEGFVIDVFRGRRQVALVTEQNGGRIVDCFDCPDMRLPVWRQIYTDIVTEITTGWLRPGDKIPSLDQLASMFCSSRNSALHALTQLKADGWATTRHRTGTYVSTQTATTKRS